MLNFISRGRSRDTAGEKFCFLVLLRSLTRLLRHQASTGQSQQHIRKTGAPRHSFLGRFCSRANTSLWTASPGTTRADVQHGPPHTHTTTSTSFPQGLDLSSGGRWALPLMLYLSSFSLFLLFLYSLEFYLLCTSQSLVTPFSYYNLSLFPGSNYCIVTHLIRTEVIQSHPLIWHILAWTSVT